MNTKKNVTLFIVGFMILAAMFACSKSSNNAQQQPPPGGNTKTINISGMTFPASTTVAKGTTVTWYNADAFPHTVTSDDGTSFNSGSMGATATFVYVANTPGTFAYHCNIHSNMKADLVVTP